MINNLTKADIKFLGRDVFRQMRRTKRANKRYHGIRCVMIKGNHKKPYVFKKVSKKEYKKRHDFLFDCLIAISSVVIYFKYLNNRITA